MIYHIYRHVLNGKSYIGYTKQSLEKRLKQHVTAAAKGSKTHFANAIRKYGAENIASECLESISTSDASVAQEREKFWIKYYNSIQDGYNLTEGGDGGNTWERNPRREETRLKLAESSRGRRHTTESKDKMRIHALSRPPIPQEAIDRAEAKRRVKRASGKYFSPEGIENLRAAGKEKVFDEAYRAKLSAATIFRKTVECPHCRKIGIFNSMMRWHFDRCKLLT